MTDPVPTIYSVASGMPPSGIAVVRISGSRTRFVIETFCGQLPPPRKAVLSRLCDPFDDSLDATVIDTALLLFFPGPKSFTGEDVAEFHVHGSRAVLARLFACLERMDGVRLAEPGEYTRRAFDNGKMDLSAAEGLGDLIEAQTEQQRRQALAQMAGSIATRAEDWRAQLLRGRMILEALLDFSDEEDVATEDERALLQGVADTVASLREAMLSALRDRQGMMVRDGFRVTLLGAPNAGKSSLLNALARRDVAIVTPEAGTTRDILEIRLDLEGFVILVEDTAGLRETENLAESLGIARAMDHAGQSDLVLFLSESGLDSVPEQLQDASILRLLSKCDRLDSDSKQNLGENWIPVSAHSGEGLARLERLMAEQAKQAMGGKEAGLVTRERHRLAVQDCLRALQSYASSTSLECQAEDLRLAGNAIGRLTGRIDVEDVLDQIFASFCIGK